MSRVPSPEPEDALPDALDILRKADEQNLAACLIPTEVRAIRAALRATSVPAAPCRCVLEIGDVMDCPEHGSMPELVEVSESVPAAPSPDEGLAIEGVLFLFVRDGAVLMERCPKKAARHGGEWFIPGGRVEPGESVLHALQREVAEELGITSFTTEPMPLFDATGGDHYSPFLMRPYVVTSWDGEVPSACLDYPDVPLRWVPLGEALRSPVPVIRALVASLAGAAPSGEQEERDVSSGNHSTEGGEATGAVEHSSERGISHGRPAVASGASASAGAPDCARAPSEEQKPAGGWRPIESAPKDGTLVLLSCYGNPVIGYYHERCGWWVDASETGDPDAWEVVPTHWMPLPPPPGAPVPAAGMERMEALADIAYEELGREPHPAVTARLVARFAAALRSALAGK